MSNVSWTTYSESNLADLTKLHEHVLFDQTTALLGIYPTEQLADMQDDKAQG